MDSLYSLCKVYAHGHEQTRKNKVDETRSDPTRNTNATKNARGSPNSKNLFKIEENKPAVLA